MKRKRVFDTESNGLALTADTMFIAVVKDIGTGERWTFPPGDDGWKEKLDEATHLIGHNIVGHDFPLLKKLYGWEPPKEALIQDTLIMSKVFDYLRFGMRGHGMATWGEYKGIKKQEHEDWSQYSEEMRTRCESDVELNEVMYNDLIQEFNNIAAKKPRLPTYLLAENAATKWAAMARMEGWPFNVPAANALKKELEEVVASAYSQLQPLLGNKVVFPDKVKGEVEVKETKWTNDGCYYAHIANWFDINPWSGYEGEERPVVGSYTRIRAEPLKLSSPADVKIFLFRNGWVPLEYNSKFDQKTKQLKFTSPKITEDSLEFLGGDGKVYREYAVASSRLAILTTWLEEVDAEGNLHGDCKCIGTPSMRATHSIIVNVPSMESKWGPEMRSLFITKPGYKLIGCDSSGNQGRGLAHYLKNEEYTYILLNDDIHVYNAKKLDRVLKDMGVSWTGFLAKSMKAKGHLKRFLNERGIDEFTYFTSERKAAKKVVLKAMRARAKRVYYAFLFGAGGAKLYGYCMGTPDAKLGVILKKGFINAVPGFSALTNALETAYSNSKKKYGPMRGFIISLAGNRLYVDSKHKLLVYLLQAFEKITCAGAIMLLMQYLEEERIPYIPHIFMHDEVDFSVPEEFAERAADLGKKAFAEGPKMFGVNIMAGSGAIGMDWKEIH